MRLVAEDGSVVVGRTLEFSELPVEDAGNRLVTEPAGTTHVMPKLPNCRKPFEFVSEHKVASKISGNKCDSPAVPQTKLATYVLSKYSSVRDIKMDLKSRDFPTVWDQADLGNPTVPVHFAFHDTSGKGIVLEYTKKEGMTFYDNTVGAMTNSPDYAWHMENLRNYPHVQRDEWKGYKYSHLGRNYNQYPQWTGTGFTGIPGDYSSPSRFIKAATLVSHNSNIANVDNAVNRMFHMLNAADIPKGIISAGVHENFDGEMVELTDYTWWMGVYDLSRKCVYFRGYLDLSVKKVCLDKIPEQPSQVNVDANLMDGVRDVTGELSQLVEG
ncbi:hypothetical protein ACHWQZ_G011399 [Mnemiopsis leidyi]